jgi:co-chaperonin GroES (HSP10)
MSATKYAISDYIIAVAIEEATTGSGKLLIPEHMRSKIKKAKVVQVGPGNNEYKMQAKENDTIMFNENRATSFEFDGKKLIAIREADCFLGVREE